jgi:hypothetical protein
MSGGKHAPGELFNRTWAIEHREHVEKTAQKGVEFGGNTKVY